MWRPETVRLYDLSQVVCTEMYSKVSLFGDSQMYFAIMYFGLRVFNCDACTNVSCRTRTRTVQNLKNIYKLISCAGCFQLESCPYWYLLAYEYKKSRTQL